jgi:hypothetical protein
MEHLTCLKMPLSASVVAESGLQARSRGDFSPHVCRKSPSNASRGEKTRQDTPWGYTAAPTTPMPDWTDPWKQGRTPRALPCVGLTVLLDRLYSRFGHVQRVRLRLAVRPGLDPAGPCRALPGPARPRVIRLASYLECTARPIGAGDVASHVTGRLARWLIQRFVQ